ncbi:retrovirus-related pol polyprotein from transposon TNT 1-94, partial [Tanacetum coccineum]
MFKLDLEPLAPKVLKNRDAHIDYIKHTQENVDILSEFVEHARALRPLDSDLDSVCKYAKRIQEVLVYVIATCPSLAKPSEKLVACMFDANHDVCFLEFVNDVNVNSKSKSTRRRKRKQTWKPTGKVSTDIGYKWKPTGRIFTIVGNSCPLTRFTSTNVEPLKETTLKSVTTTKLEIKINRRKTKVAKSVDLNSRILGSRKTNISEPNTHWEYTVSNSPSSSLVDFRVSRLFSGTIRFDNDQIAKIMGYSDYQMGNIKISWVYYVEGLGHNLFLVGQFCDSDLKVAFRNHSCYIRDLEGVDLLKGSRGSNLYTLSLEDMISSSPICLLSKASKTKSWLWHRRKPDLSYLHVFGALCYPTNDNEDLGKLKPKADIGIFVGSSPAKKAFRIYNKRTRLIIETIQPNVDEYFNPPPCVASLVPSVVVLVLADSTGSPSSTPVDQDAPSPSNSQTTQASQSPVASLGVVDEFHDIKVVHLNNDPFFGVPFPE